MWTQQEEMIRREGKPICGSRILISKVLLNMWEVLNIATTYLLINLFVSSPKDTTSNVKILGDVDMGGK